MEIKSVKDAAFRKYGRVISEIDFSELVAKMDETPLPADVVYEPSVELLEALPVMEKLQTAYYGELPIQIGYCNGNNHLLNALEYHRSSELDIAATDAILLLGSQQDTLKFIEFYDVERRRRCAELLREDGWESNMADGMRGGRGNMTGSMNGGMNSGMGGMTRR